MEVGKSADIVAVVTEIKSEATTIKTKRGTDLGTRKLILGDDSGVGIELAMWGDLAFNTDIA